ncbi:MAG: DUF1015 domain-containing protein [Planctomycetota bacterium]|nr:MAG: DUF1015 domain-containing protein [Planctomycetota bacterium]
MAKIRPFRGNRPRPDVVSKIACPPYDVLSSEEAREIVKDNPMSFLRVVKAEVDLDPSVDVHGEEVYEKSAENLQKLISDGLMVRDEKPCFYVYQQKMGGHVQAGIVAGASVDEYRNGLIKKHEFTRPDKETDRARHVEILGANAGPVFLTYRASKKVDEIVEKVRAGEPVYDFTAEDGVGHTFWVVDEEEIITALENAFEEIPALYVADGHHRSAAASRVREIRKEADPDHTGGEQYNYFLTVIFPDDQMQIMDYNRVVKDLGGMSETEFMEEVSECFEVLQADEGKPTGKKTFGMFLGGKWFRLRAKEGSYPADDPVESLDAAILQANLFSHVLDINDPRTDSRIDFVGGIRGMAELERRCAKDAVAAFAVYPVSIGELLAVADAGKVMPPKCTWFEPKLRSGVVVKMLDE